MLSFPGTDPLEAALMSVTRRDFLTSTASALAVGAGAARLRAQAPPVPPPVPRFQDLRGGVGLFTAQGGTIGYLVNDAGAWPWTASTPTPRRCSWPGSGSAPRAASSS